MRGWSTAGVAIVITSRCAHRRTLFISTERSLVESICSRESVPPNKALKLTARSPRPVWHRAPLNAWVRRTVDNELPLFELLLK